MKKFNPDFEVMERFAEAYKTGLSGAAGILAQKIDDGEDEAKEIIEEIAYNTDEAKEDVAQHAADLLAGYKAHKDAVKYRMLYA